MKVRISDSVAKPLVASILAIPPCVDTYPPDSHVEVQIPHQPPGLTSIISTATVTSHVVTYSAPGFGEINRR
jgi:hypothetical protein